MAMRLLYRLVLTLWCATGLLLTVLPGAAWAQPSEETSAESALLAKLLSSVVGVASRAGEDARSNATLGRNRVGSGVVIDEAGHILTIGYLVIESESIDIALSNGASYPARLVGYDHATGLAVLKSILPIKLSPVTIGDSTGLKDQELLIILPHLGLGPGSPAQLVSRRNFAGSWEYMLEKPIYTFPANPTWAGAPLLTERGELVGVGSLFVRDAISEGVYSPGNLFVPIEVLKPILADLISRGRRSSRVNPWMGITPDDSSGWVGILRVSKDGPADRAGLRPGDFITAIDGKEIFTLKDLYQRAWGLGGAGTRIPMEVERMGRRFPLVVESIDRTDFFIQPRGY